jgi:hypothetical protein
MEISNKPAFNGQKFISVGLLLNFTVLIITAVLIQIYEALEEDFFIHLFTVVHIFTGFAFTVLGVLHTKKHWKLVKIYIKKKELVVSNEAVYAFLLTVITILTGSLFVHIFLY